MGGAFGSYQQTSCDLEKKDLNIPMLWRQARMLKSNPLFMLFCLIVCRVWPLNSVITLQQQSKQKSQKVWQIVIGKYANNFEDWLMLFFLYACISFCIFGQVDYIRHKSFAARVTLHVQVIPCICNRAKGFLLLVREIKFHLQNI